MSTNLFQTDNSDCDHEQESGTYRCIKCKATNFWVVPYKADSNPFRDIAAQRRDKGSDRRGRAG